MPTPLNIVLLGEDPAVLPLIRAIVARDGCRLMEAALVGRTLSALQESVPGLRVHPEWEAWLQDDTFDAVIVAGRDERVLDAARQLAAAGKAVLLFPQAAQGSSFIYRLTLVRDDTHVVLFPALTARLDPHVQELARWMTEARMGRVLHLRWERELRAPAADEVDDDRFRTEAVPDNSDSDPASESVARASSTTDAGVPLLSPTDVDEALLHDGDVLRFLGGDYNQVTALHSGVTEEGIAMATVTLAGENLPEASWTLRPTAGSSSCRLTVVGERGEARLTVAPGSASLEWESKADPSETESREYAADDFDRGNELLSRFSAALAGETESPDWTDVTRAFEIVDGAHRSLARRRTIDLFFETTSERAIFKTQMTAIGCGVLVFTLMALVLYLLVANVLAEHKLLLQALRVLWIAPLVLFLLLQLLIFLARPSSERQREQQQAEVEQKHRAP